MCLAVGCPHPDYLPLDAVQLAEWEAYYSLRPFGEQSADLRMGIVTATIANVNRGPKSAKVFKPMDFMPFVKEPDQTPEDIAGVVSGARQAWCGR